MILAEEITRNENKTATEEFVRGSVWAYLNLVLPIFYDKSRTDFDLLDCIEDLKYTINDKLESQKESYEFNRGAMWGMERFAWSEANDKYMGIKDILVCIAGFGSDVIKQRKEFLEYCKENPEEMKDAKIQEIQEFINWAENIDNTKGW